MDGVRASASAEDLALEAQRGSVHAFEQLVERFHRPLYGYLWVRTRDPSAAEDLTQEAFLRAWQRIGLYDARWRFSTWLYTLASRLAISAARSAGKGPPQKSAPELLGQLSAGSDPAEVALETDEGRALWELAGRVLRAEECTALWLRYAEERSTDEIAEILGLEAVSVRVLLFRARGRLGAALEASEKDSRNESTAPLRGTGPGPRAPGSPGTSGPGGHATLLQGGIGGLP